LSSKADRRKFLKYIGAGLVAATAAGAGYYFYGRQPSPKRTETATIPKGWESATTYLRNNPPGISEMDVKPKYINPTTETTMRFSHSSYHPDNDPLSTKWLIDGEDISHEPEHSTKLSEGDHSIALKVSDGKSEAMRSATVTVRPDQIYPTRPLHVKFKGVCYLTGMPQWNNESPSEDEMNEHLEVIHNELGCNGIRIAGYYDDDVLRCARLAIEKGFECIQLDPRYLDCNHQDTVERLGAFAEKAEELRQRTDTIQLQVANELCIDSLGIWNGESYVERATSGWVGVPETTWRSKLQSLLLDLVKVSRRKFGGLISYASGFWEADAVPWEHFDVIGVNAYVQTKDGWTEDVVASKLNNLKKYSKPVYITEFGCATYAGAGKYGGSGWFPSYCSGSPYDEDEQANYYRRYLDLINQVGVYGCSPYVFSEVYADDEVRSTRFFSMINNATKSRKKSFYAYKSYQRELP